MKIKRMLVMVNCQNYASVRFEALELRLLKEQIM